MAESIFGSETNGGNGEFSSETDAQRIEELEKQIDKLNREIDNLNNEMRDLGILDQSRKKEFSGKIMDLEEQIDAHRATLSKLKGQLYSAV